MEIVKISSDIWYVPEFHLFFRAADFGFRFIQEAVLDYVSQYDIIAVAERISKNKLIASDLLPQEEQLLGQLRTLTVEVTSACNMRCPYCYLFGSGRFSDAIPASRNLDEKVFLTRLDSIFSKSQEKNICIQFIGGEPLVCAKLLTQITPQIFALARQYEINLKLQIITNGTLLTKSLWSFLEEYQVEVILSLDGPPSIQNQIRPMEDGNPSFEMVMRNIEGHEDGISVLFMLCKQTRRLTDNVRWFLNKGFHSVSFNYIYTNDSDIGLDREDCQDILQDIDENLGFYIDNLDRIRNFSRFAKCIYTSYPQITACNAGRNYVALGADNELYLCQRCFGDSSMRLSNLRSEVSKRNLSTVQDTQSCCTCWARYICGGLCWFNTWFWPEEYQKIRCEFTRQFIRRVALVCFSKSEKVSATSS